MAQFCVSPSGIRILDEPSQRSARDAEGDSGSRRVTPPTLPCGKAQDAQLGGAPAPLRRLAFKSHFLSVVFY
jgi:hypothetical protein